MQEHLDRLTKQLDDCMLSDRRRLRARLAGIRKYFRQGRPADQAVAALRMEITQSLERRARRAECMPRPEYPEELPLTARRGQIAAAIRANQVVVVAGETGSGKTTQLPKLCLELGRGVAGMIGHTQPRRIAARSVAVRVAGELESELGRAVGYQVRFHDRVSPDSYIKLMTDGILLAETRHDRDLLQYDTLILDEAHERSLNIDFLLGYLKQLLPRRPDLKVIITSATIDTERFARHFSDAPVVEVSGRTYPVEVRYRPLQDPDSEDRDPQQAIVDAVAELARIDRGDILVFLAGEREIRETADALRKHHPPETEILPLFARLSVTEQNRVFQPHGRHRIVLATNVAETSLTVPGIRYVIDTGYARVSRYSYRSKVQRLPIEKISRASADQRKGRCGRLSAGVCIRLYDEQDFLARPEFTEPEILRTNLAAVILRMLDLDLGDVDRFPFVEPPDARYVNDGYRLLTELGAVDARRRLTPLGRQLARFPTDPRIARMILAARDEHCLNEVLVIASALTVQDPRERPLEAREKADQAHRHFQDERSDFLTFLKLWQFYHEHARRLSRNKLRKLCREYFLAAQRMQEWHDIHQQFGNQVKDMGMRLNQQPAEYDAIHRALLAGLLGNLGCRGEGHEYDGGHGKKFAVFPGSVLFKQRPKWVMAAELVETARLYAHTVAAIKPEWVERLAPHLVKRSYAEPHWEKRPAQVAAYEKVSLYGLTLIPRRRVNYGPIDPVEAREIFIRAALVEGRYDSKAPFFRRNRAFVEEVQALEDKSRRRDILVDDETLFGFYGQRIPHGIYSGKAFEKWRTQAERGQPELLLLSREQLMRHGAVQVTEARFPDTLSVAGMELQLEYRFEPGDPADGVTLVVPLVALNALQPGYCGWLVPGLLQDKIVHLIKTLPKALRRHFVPAPDFAGACLQALSPGDGALLDALARQLERMTGVQVPRESWRPDALPAHLNMNFKVVDEHGRQLAAGRDLEQLQRQLGERARESFARLPDLGIERERVTTWDFGDLPEVVEARRGGLTLCAYPALVEEGEMLALRLLDTPAEAVAAQRVGLCRLFMLGQAGVVGYVRKNLPGIQAMCMHYAPVGNCEELKDDLIAAAVERALLGGDGVEIRSAAVFEQRSDAARAHLPGVANQLCALTAAVLVEHHAAAKRIRGSIPPAWLHAIGDIRAQLDQLVFRGFLRQTPADALRHLPRYLKAIHRRLEKLDHNPVRDREAMLEIMPLWQAWLERRRRHRQEGIRDPELETYRWMLEELRVSLFAQELKTVRPVSVKRLRQQWEKVAA